MKVLTFRLGQFALSGLLLTVSFRYVLNLCIETRDMIGALVCSIVYFCLMFLIGWHFGKKDDIENEIYDLGFRMHLTTYILCTSVGISAYFVGWNTESLTSMQMSALYWGIGLAVHFLCFLIAQRKAIKGYAKDEIFQ